jgi:hypothetical protein
MGGVDTFSLAASIRRPPPDEAEIINIPQREAERLTQRTAGTSFLKDT